MLQESMKPNRSSITRRLPVPRLLALAVLAAVLPAAVASAQPSIHAHRGGPLQTEAGQQQAALAEATLETFEQRAKEGFVLELDVKLTSDGVPVVIHDDSLDRTTDCEGAVAGRTAAALRAQCVVDTAGTSSTTEELAPGDPRRAPVPTLDEVLKMADAEGVEVNLEIKNVPTDSDFDPSPVPGFAETVAAGIKASGFPPKRLIVQSFWPPNLDVIESDPELADAETSFLTLAQSNDTGPSFAKARGYEWVSPAWPIDDSYVFESKSLGLRIAPYTLDEAAQIEQAAALAVDAIITNDPVLARELLQGPAPPPPPDADLGPCEKRVRGTLEADRMSGTKGGDDLRGRSGDDRINGRGGDDCLNGQSGNDVLQGGRGADTLLAGSGNDTAKGGDGRDVIRGGSGNDRLVGGNGPDRIKAGAGRDVVSGSKGDDKILVVGGGRDKVSCGAGNDRVTIDRGIDQVAGNCERVIER